MTKTLNNMLSFSARLGLLAGLAAMPATAQQMMGGGDNMTIVYDAGPQGNVVGGGPVRVVNGVSGGLSTTYLERFTPATVVGAARIVGGGDNAEITYAPAWTENSILAQRAR